MTTKKKDEPAPFVGPPQPTFADVFGAPPAADSGPVDTRTMQEKLESQREQQIAAGAPRAAPPPRPGTQAYVDAEQARQDAAEQAKVDAVTPQPIDPNDVVAGAPPAAQQAVPSQGVADAGATPWRHVGGGGGGMVAATETPRVGPQVMGAFQTADESARAAAGNIEGADRDQAILDQATLLDERKRMEAEQQAIAAREKDRALELKARQEHADALAEEASHYGVDSNRLWNNKSTGAKIGAILAMSLGAFGKNNDALDMFNTAKQQDIDEQKHNIALMGEHAAAAKGLVGLAQSRFGDERQAEQAAHIAYIEAAKVRLQQMAAADKSVEATDNYQRMMTGLDEQLAERKKELLAYTPAHYAGGGGDQIDKKRLQNRIAELRDKSAAEGKPVSVDDAFRTAVAEQGFGDPLAGRGGLPTYGKAEAKKGRGFDPENLTFNAPGGEGAFQARSTAVARVAHEGGRQA